MIPDWSREQPFVSLDRVVEITHESKATVYAQLARGEYPIAPLPRRLGCRYRFLREHVRAWVERGEITNPRHPLFSRGLRRAG